jgi:hypothetical protein
MMRVNVAQKVAKFKKKLSNKVTYKTNRSKVTNFIASNHSRQEFPPLIGKLSDKAVIEPLHLKNNIPTFACNVSKASTFNTFNTFIIFLLEHF